MSQKFLQHHSKYKRMNQSNNQDELQKITPIIKIVKQRQQLYLSLLNFINKNIQSTSNQHQQLTLFSKFLGYLKTQQKDILLMEKDILKYFEPDQMQGSNNMQQSFNLVKQVTKSSKQILRLCARLIQIIDTSITKTRQSIFNDDGHLTLQFNRFKRQLHNIIKGETVHLGQFTKFVLNFVKLKYKKQLVKVEKYVYKLQAGAIVALKQMYIKQKSQQQGQHNELKQRYPKAEHNNNFSKTQKHLPQQEERHELHSESQSPKKSLKRPSLTKSSTKKGHKLLKQNKKQIPQTKPKQFTANKLLKHYNMLELSKKQFLEDMVYEQLQQEEHRRKLMNSLLERNKTIQGQISTYYKKTIVYKQKIDKIAILISSGEQKQRQSKQKRSGDESSVQGMLKASSLRKSFVISKRKSSLNFQKNSKILTENDQSFKGDIFIKTVKHLPVRRKSAAETTQRSLTNKSKKLFVIKSPVVFEDEHIPKAPTQSLAGGSQGWFRPPLTARKPQKKNENIRLKRRNNPLPIQNSLFNQSFKFTDNSHF